MTQKTTSIRIYTKDLPVLAMVERAMMKGQPRGTRFNSADVLGECLSAKINELAKENKR